MNIFNAKFSVVGNKEIRRVFIWLLFAKELIHRATNYAVFTCSLFY